MGNTPTHHKRRLSSEGDYRLSGTTPTYLSVTIPPSKRRNMHSMSDLSKSAPPNYIHQDSPFGALRLPAQLLDSDRLAMDETTSMLRAASLRDSSATGRPGDTDMIDAGEDSLPQKMRSASAGHSSSIGVEMVESIGLDQKTVERHRLRTHTSPPWMGSSRTEVRAASEPPNVPCPTVFRWNGGGEEVYISGTFNNWKKRIPMVKRKSGVYVIIDCTPGTHEYKYFIDGAWYHDPTKPTVDNALGTKNNLVNVKPSDFNVIEALQSDQANSRHRPNHLDSADPDALSQSPPGDYGQYIPSNPAEPDALSQSPPGDYGQYIPSNPAEVKQRSSMSYYSSTGPIAPGIGTISQPPLLPPHLLQGILNMDTGVHCDPNLLPPPNHVIVNHLYALSIKDGVIVLSVITRYRHKFVSTVFYKPILD